MNENQMDFKKEKVRQNEWAKAKSKIKNNIKRKKGRKKEEKRRKEGK